MHPQAYLTRSFCILEIFAAVDAGATLLVQMHFLRAFDVASELAASPVDAKAAQTRREKDKATIDGFVEAMPGGFETLNTTITEAIKKGCDCERGTLVLVDEVNQEHIRRRQLESYLGQGLRPKPMNPLKPPSKLSHQERLITP